MDVSIATNGSVRIVGIEAYHHGANGVAPRYNLFGRTNMVFDRRNGTPRTRFAARRLAPNAPPSAGGGGGGGGNQGGGMMTITRSATSGLVGSYSGATQAARNAAEAAVRSACEMQGGRPSRVTSTPTGTRQVTDRTYRGSATATGQCRM
ncbi:MAG: hypothetical protein AAGK00_12935 [Pseudomonadota bacterium]